MTTKSIILSGGLVAALLLAAAGAATAQTYRNRLPTRPANPAPATGSGLVTPSMGSFANPNFSNYSPAPTAGVSPTSNQGFNQGFNSFNPGFNSFNPGFNNFSPYNQGFGGFGNFAPFANPYSGFGFNPSFSPYNNGFYPGANPFGGPFNPYFGNGMYNPLLGY